MASPTTPPAVAAAAGVALVASLSWSYVVDDAFIIARYAERWAHGDGWTFVDGPATDGVTSLLFGAMLAGATTVGLSAVTVAKVVGVVGASTASFLTVKACSSPSIAWWVAGFLALSANLGIWSGAGLETGLATLVLTSAWRLSGHAGPWCALLGGLLGWLRPELVVAATVFTMLGPNALRRAALMGLVAWSSMLLRIVVFASPLPLSTAAKPPGSLVGVEYALLGVLVITGGVGVLLVMLGTGSSDRLARSMGFAAAIHGVVVVFVGGDWMPGFRLFVPVLPGVAYVAGAGLAGATTTRRATTRRVIRVLALLTLIGLAVDLAVQLPRARKAGFLREGRGQEFARYLERYPCIALVDVGFLSWTGGFDVVDLGGLVDPTIARLPGGYLAKRIPEGLLSARNPDAIVVHSSTRPIVDENGWLTHFTGFPVEHWITGMNSVERGYRVAHVMQYSDAYWYIALVRVKS